MAAGYTDVLSERKRSTKKIKKVSSTFSKVAGYKGSALGRAPQSAEFSVAFLFDATLRSKLLFSLRLFQQRKSG